MTPEEYYKKEFPKQYSLLKGIESNQLFSLKSCFMLMEMYHKSEVERIISKTEKS